jgi:hypothetical protein
MSSKATNQTAIIASMFALAASHNNKEHCFGLNGNIYPINNKKGFASKDKRKKR